MRSFTTTILTVSLAMVIAAPAIAQEPDDPRIGGSGMMVLGSSVSGELARVRTVVDGDTIRVDVGDGNRQTVEYLGLRSPGRAAEGGSRYLEERATEANRRLVQGSWVILERDATVVEDDGSVRRYVWAPTDEGLRLVNYELVRQGLATVDPTETDPSTSTLRYGEPLRQAAQRAERQGVGVWAPTVVPVSAWRSQFCIASQSLVEVQDQYGWFVNSVANGTFTEIALQASWLKDEALASRRAFNDVPENAPGVVKRYAESGRRLANATIKVADAGTRTALQPRKLTANVRRLKTQLKSLNQRLKATGKAVKRVGGKYPDLCVDFES